jgi:iron complex outermembrane receptor protein
LKKAPGTPEIGTAGIIEGASPQHQGLVESSWELSRRLELDLTYRYVSSLPSQPVPSYSTGDARLAWRVTPRFEISFVGRNLLQPSHFEYQGDPGPLVGIKRSVYVKVTWTR